MNARDRQSIARAARSALEVVGTFGLHGFKVCDIYGREAGQIHVAKVSTGHGFGWKCMRCRTSGAFYGQRDSCDASVPLARFIRIHTAEACPC